VGILESHNLYQSCIQRKKWVWPLGVADPPPRAIGGGFGHPQAKRWPLGVVQLPQGQKINFFFYLALGVANPPPKAMGVASATPNRPIGVASPPPCPKMWWPATPYGQDGVANHPSFLYLFLIFYYFVF
jgi:hypothetical protein